ncbi:hypothetical protein SLEP1_g28364 [Rubroshorea leprosula]|uniref:Uncharacterized protein n=1 Tax=Rubroshorea leprosula TaxID=152421 RepID=A0AAV5K242_9ROSI|nr:hypothetical protein SLEP1_g28364 [Rubroshorea leprosula]
MSTNSVHGMAWHVSSLIEWGVKILITVHQRCDRNRKG